MAHAHIDQVRLVSHSNVVYWWPAWLFGYLIAMASYFQGDTVTLNNGVVQYVHPSNGPGLLFIAVLVLLIIFTNAQLRGIYSVVTLVTVGFFTVLLAWLGWVDSILKKSWLRRRNTMPWVSKLRSPPPMRCSCVIWPGVTVQ